VRRFLPISLTARIALAVVVLMALVSLVIGGLTTAAVNGYLTDQLDQKVAESHHRAIDAREGGPSHSDDDHRPRPPDLEGPRGQDAGTLTAHLTVNGSVGNRITNGGQLDDLTPEALSALAGLSTDGTIRTLDLPHLGRYRLQATRQGETTVVTGFPTEDLDDAFATLIGWELLFSVLGVVAAGVLAVVVVRRQLRPLREVARTAHEVADIPLSSGEIGITARVPDELTDDRTEVGQVGVALNTLLSHMEESLDARHRSELQVRQFVADASHELRTPLATIQGYSELGLRVPDQDRLVDAMAKVRSEATRMTALVEDLLLLARLDAGRPLDRREVDLSRLVVESVADARVVGPDHRWALTLAEDAVTVTGDEDRLHQVLNNLLANARQHTPSGATVTIGVRVADDGRTALLTVHDDGPGVPAELQATLFERFTRADVARTRESGGAGLGLSLAQAIVEAHRGTLSVSSHPGSTTFTVSLPF
jgi:two-component system OmpR family sensor kinase